MAQGQSKHATQHRELLVQMQINRGNASAGGSGANVSASAMISVLVTMRGEPVDDLGASVGTQTSAISLPAGWTLRDGFNVRPGGCNISVTEFSNQGGGLYDIRIVPFVGNPAWRGCRVSMSTPFSWSSRARSVERPSCSEVEHWASSASSNPSRISTPTHTGRTDTDERYLINSAPRPSPTPRVGCRLRLMPRRGLAQRPGVAG